MRGIVGMLSLTCRFTRAQTIIHVIDTSMASNSYNKAREAMRACRSAAAEEDEAAEWNK